MRHRRESCGAETMDDVCQISLGGWSFGRSCIVRVQSFFSCAEIRKSGQFVAYFDLVLHSRFKNQATAKTRCKTR